MRVLWPSVLVMAWLRVYFYPSLTAAERASAATGHVESIRTAWAAVLQFTVDKRTTVWQVDLSYRETRAPSPGRIRQRERRFRNFDTPAGAFA